MSPTTQENEGEKSECEITNIWQPHTNNSKLASGNRTQTTPSKPRAANSPERHENITPLHTRECVRYLISTHTESHLFHVALLLWDRVGNGEKKKMKSNLSVKT